MTQCAISRLKRRPDFLRAQKEGRSWVSPSVIIQWVPSASAALTDIPAKPLQVRVGFTATKKLGGAVDRNRVRRRLKSAVAALPPLFLSAGDLVLIGRKDTAMCAYAQLERDLRWALRRVGAFAGPA